MLLSECLLLIEDIAGRTGNSLWSDGDERLRAKPSEARTERSNRGWHRPAEPEPKVLQTKRRDAEERGAPQRGNVSLRVSAVSAPLRYKFAQPE
jgi:hypothetical protein